jgi:TatD DNase family protein
LSGIIDTHAHLDDPKFREDFEDVRARALQAGVTRVISAGGDITSSRHAAIRRFMQR